MADDMRRLLTIKEAALILSMAPRTLYNRTGKKAKDPLPIKIKRLGKSVRILAQDLDAYIESL